MPDTPTNYYKAGITLLTALAQLEYDIKHNYENGDVHQRALANIAGLQSDLLNVRRTPEFYSGGGQHPAGHPSTGRWTPAIW